MFKQNRFLFLFLLLISSFSFAHHTYDEASQTAQFLSNYPTFQTTPSASPTSQRISSQPSASQLSAQLSAQATSSQITFLNSEISSLSSSYASAQKTSSQQSSYLLTTLQAKAQQRKSLMLKLLPESPEEFIYQAISSKKLKVPSELSPYFEQQTSLQGNIEVIHFDDFANNKGTFKYSIRTPQGKLDYFPVGQQPELRSGALVKVNGFQLENKIVSFADKSSFEVLKTEDSPALGEQKLLVLLVRFLDSQDPPPYTREEAQYQIFNGQFQKFIREASYNQTYFTGNAYGWYTLNRTGYVNNYCRWPDFGSYGDYELDNIIQSNNIDLNEYGRILILADHSCMGGGYSSVGRWPVLVNNILYNLSLSWSLAGYPPYFSNDPINYTTLEFVISHELGHALGVAHANLWSCKSSVMYGPCDHSEYGNIYDVMGNARGGLHFNAMLKDILGWFNSSSIITINNSGTYLLNPLELGSGVRAAKIRDPNNSSNFSYYVEYRKPYGFDSMMGSTYPSDYTGNKGLFVNWQTKNFWMRSRLLDMSPAAYPTSNNVTLNQGGKYKDDGRGISLIPRGSNNQSIKFDVGIYQAKCVYNYPTITNIYAPPGFYAGISYRLDVQTWNYDGPLCPVSDFNLSLSVPEGWVYQVKIYDGSDFINSSVNPILQEDSLWYYIDLLAPPDTTAGYYFPILIMTNLNGNLTRNYTFGIPVQAPIYCSDGTLMTTCSSIKPKYCTYNGELVDACYQCGCPGSDYVCHYNGSCVQAKIVPLKPLNNYISKYSRVNISATVASDVPDVMYCWYYVNDTIRYADAISPGYNSSFLDTYSNGAYSWKLNCSPYYYSVDIIQSERQYFKVKAIDPTKSPYPGTETASKEISPTTQASSTSQIQESSAPTPPQLSSSSQQETQTVSNQQEKQSGASQLGIQSVSNLREVQPSSGSARIDKFNGKKFVKFP
ncbi:hypothetical protein FJZ26_03740, partial [Candidatus Parvarchaeota archaeon]|nr:hypothetical protein [Candidatus Parvarchaeota archaeon]